MTNPTPFTGTERDYLRALFGVSRLFTSANSMFENLLNSIDGLYNDSVDAGATQAAIRAVIVKLQAVDAQLSVLSNQMLGTAVGDIKFDAQKNDWYLRNVVGPGLINQISQRISFNPLSNYFGTPTINGISVRILKEG